MATAVTSVPAAQAASEPGPASSSSAASHDVSADDNFTDTAFAPALDGVVHPGLRMDMRTNSGAQRDGRVRNPIPSKLKGKTDNKKGNFNVMHMDISNASESQARYDAAKRNSESTALQAKLAETDHYVSHHRRANYARPRLPRASSPQETPPAVPAAPPPPSNRPLNAEETKAQQARLLTLLRTLPHASIVDQLCKALAFFGGIPDAPPPQDGKFPESAEANGSGSLFIGWISEIFPDLDNPRKPIINLAPPSKRPRGRPKGSKATKVRRDKGIKKGSKAATGNSSSALHAIEQNGDDEGWVDVDDSMVDLERQADSVEDRVLNLLQTPPRNHVVGIVDAIPSMGLSVGPGGAGGDPASASKKRGRPKGSKNKAKDASAQETPQQPVSATGIGADVSPNQQLTGGQASNGSATDAGKKKAATVKSKGSKKPKAPKDNAQHNATPTQRQPAVMSNSYVPPPTLPISVLPQPPATSNSISVSALGGNSNKPKRSQVPQPPVADPPVISATPQVKESTIVGVKRKRPSNKPPGTGGHSGVATSVGIEQGTTSTQSNAPATLPVASGAASQPQAEQAISGSGNSSSTAAPPPKRARKSNSAASKRQNSAVTGANGSSAVGAGDALPAQQMLQNATPQSHSRAEGLEAHMERIAAHQNRNDQQSQLYGGQQQHQTSITNGQTIPSASADGLDGQYERFSGLQNRQQSQQNNVRQQSRQQQAQTASPPITQVTKAPQMATLPSQQQSRASSNTPNYYSSQTPSYALQQGAYTTNQRQPPNPATSSPGAALVSHVTHSPQFGSHASNSPLLSTENAFRASPALGFAPRRTPSASSMDNNYRTSGVSSQSPHFGNAGRPTAAGSHQGVPASSFPSFSDPSIFDMQSFDGSGTHAGMGLGSPGTYGMNSTSVQRANSSTNASAYANSAAAAMTNGAYDSTGLGKASMNTGYQAPGRWP